MDQETLGRLGGLLGTVLGGGLGLLGGIFGTYCSIKNTKGPCERAFVIRASLICWTGATLFGVGLWLLPQPYSLALIPLYVVALLLGVRHWNKRQAAIRLEESSRGTH